MYSILILSIMHTQSLQELLILSGVRLEKAQAQMHVVLNKNECALLIFASPTKLLFALGLHLWVVREIEM